MKLNNKILVNALAICCSINFAVADELDDSLKPHLDQIYDQLTVQSKTAVASCQTLALALNSPSDRTTINQSFNHLVQDWKRVQSLYVIGEYDDNAIDTPHYIDTYHRGKEDLYEQIQRILKTATNDAKTALFKNSFKTINALEYVLYDNNGELTKRQQELSAVITSNICKRLATVNAAYNAHKTDFLKKPKKAIAIIINELIDNSYKLREWRLGDAAGLSRKNHGNPNDKFIEYRLSNQSIAAAKAIMESHTQQTQADSELAKIVAKIAEFDEIEEPVTALANAREYTAIINRQLATLNDADITNPQKIKPIYKALNNLNDSYLIELIESMSDVVARVLDSDGD